jgi:hypothetical protein
MALYYPHWCIIHTHFAPKSREKNLSSKILNFCEILVFLLSFDFRLFIMWILATAFFLFIKERWSCISFVPYVLMLVECFYMCIHNLLILLDHIEL